MLAVAKGSIHQRLELGIAESIVAEAGQHRRKPRDGGADHAATRLHDTCTLAQRFEPVVLLGHVIEGPHQENEISEGIGEG